MKTICLIETAPDGLNTVKSYLSEMNTRFLMFGTVDEAVRSGASADLVVLLGRKDLPTYKTDIFKIKSDSTLSKIPRISVLPFHFTMHRSHAGIMEGEQEFFMPVDKLGFLSSAARSLNIPQRRKFKIVVSIIPDEGTLKYSGFSVDFSETGMSFETSAVLIPGQSVAVSFVNPKNRTRLTLKAEVIRRALTETATATFYGIRFRDLSEQDTDNLKKFISGKGD